MLKPSQRSRETDWTGARPGRLGAALTLWHVQVSHGSDVCQGAPSPACERWPARRSRLGFSQLVGPRRHRGPVASSRPRLFPEAEAQRPGHGQRPLSPALFRAALQTRCSLRGRLPGRGGWAAAPRVPSASGVPRGGLRIEQQMLLFRRSARFMPETDVDFFFRRLSMTHNSV